MKSIPKEFGLHTENLDEGFIKALNFNIDLLMSYLSKEWMSGRCQNLCGFILLIELTTTIERIIRETY